MFPFELVSQLSALAMRQNPREDTRVGHKFMPIGSITPCTRVYTCVHVCRLHFFHEACHGCRY